jgi:hypothetical protein
MLSAADLPNDIDALKALLIADPKRFDGQTVRVIGYLHLEFEGNAVYLSKPAWL